MKKLLLLLSLLLATSAWGEPYSYDPGYDIALQCEEITVLLAPDSYAVRMITWSGESISRDHSGTLRIRDQYYTWRFSGGADIEFDYRLDRSSLVLTLTPDVEGYSYSKRSYWDCSIIKVSDAKARIDAYDEKMRKRSEGYNPPPKRENKI